MKKILLFFALMLLQIAPVHAVTLQATENLVLTETLTDDAYILAGNGTIENDVNGDLYIGGGNVVINGNIIEDLVVAGGKVTVMGNVMGDIRVIGGQIAIYGLVGDDVVIMGGQVDIGKKSIVNGSLVTMAGILTVDGKIGEDIRGMLGVLFLNGEVNRDITVTVEDSMHISASAKIGGNLNYSALVESTIPKGVVGGKTSFNQFTHQGILEGITYALIIQKVISYFGALFLLFLIVIFMQKSFLSAAITARANVLKAFGVGLLTAIGAVVGSIILMMTVIGIPLAIIVLSVMLIVCFIAKLFASAWIAGYFINLKKKVSKVKLFFVIAAALLVYSLLGMIPYLGKAINVILFLIGTGSMVLMKIEIMKLLKSKKLI